MLNAKSSATHAAQRQANVVCFINAQAIKHGQTVGHQIVHGATLGLAFRLAMASGVCTNDTPSSGGQQAGLFTPHHAR
jgi:hypothetical protein